MPEQDMDEFERALREIREGWAARLPARLDELRAALRQCQAAPREAARWESLLGLLHGLSGSAGSFGFEELGARATEVELQLKAGLDGGVPRDPVAAADAMEQLLDAAGGQLPASAARLVYLVQDHPETEVAAQLRHFGYAVETLVGLDALPRRMQQRAPAAVLLDLAFPDGVMAGASVLARLRQQNGARFATVFLSPRSSFAARLATVRAGADSYFSGPVDMATLVDRLDALIGAEQTPAYRILLVDDDPDAAEFHAAVLRAAGMEVRALYHPADVLEALGDYRPELVLMDVYMPDCDGTELARLIRQDDRYLDMPIVFLSSEDDRGKQLQAVEAGADDFLSKPIQPAHLVSAVSSRARRYRTLRSLITRDSLTGLLNHSALKEQLGREVSRAARAGAPLAVAMLDIDHFKQVNDRHGHPVGDQVIRALSRLLQQRLRRGDIVGRYGGEEFAVIMPATGAAAAQQVMDDIRVSFAKLHHHAEQEDFSVCFSAGVTGAGQGDDAESLLRRADEALYVAKRQGRNRVAVA